MLKMTYDEDVYNNHDNGEHDTYDDDVYNNHDNGKDYQTCHYQRRGQHPLSSDFSWRFQRFKGYGFVLDTS